MAEQIRSIVRERIEGLTQMADLPIHPAFAHVETKPETMPLIVLALTFVVPNPATPGP